MATPRHGGLLPSPTHNNNNNNNNGGGNHLNSNNGAGGGGGSGSSGAAGVVSGPPAVGGSTVQATVTVGKRRWCCRLCPSRVTCTWNPRTRLILFFVCYAIFLAPVLVALIREFYGFNAEIKQDHLLLPIMHRGGPAFLFALSQWLGTLLVVYVVYRVVGRRVGIKLHEKTLAKHKDDILRLVYFGMTMAAVGGIASRIEEGVVNSETGLSFIPLTLAYCVFFTFIFELVKERDITLSVGLLENKIGMIVVALGFCTCVLVLVCLFLTAWQVSSSFFAMYCGVTAVGCVAHLAMFYPTLPGVPGRSYLHLHHWYWSVPLAHMCVFHTDVSMLAQAIFLAVHIHGVDCFGVEPLFYDTERRARHPSDFDWVLKEHPHERRHYEDFVPKEDPDIQSSSPQRRLKAGSTNDGYKRTDEGLMNGTESADEADESDALVAKVSILL